MVEKQNNELKDWNGVEIWLTELIEQTRANAKRWFIAFLVAMAALVATNAYWIYVFQSYDYISQDGSGLNNINTGNQGDVVNGAESQTEEERQEQRGEDEKKEEVGR